MCDNDEDEDKLETHTGQALDIEIEYGRNENKEGKLLGKKAEDVAYRHRLFHTVCISISIFALGWRNALIGPTLPDLRLLTNEDLSKVSLVFTAKSLGGLFGSVCGGFAYDRFSKIGVFVSTVLAMGIMTAITPWCYHLAALLVAHFFHGVFASAVETASTADVTFVWKQNAGPFMQAVQFAFSAGAMLSPLTADPFLAEEQFFHSQFAPEHSNSSIVSSADQEIIAPSFDFENMTRKSGVGFNITSVQYGKSRVYVPYTIASFVCFASACLYLPICYFYGNVYKTSLIEISERKNVTFQKRYFLSKKMKVIFTILLAVALLFYVVNEYCFIGFLMTFIISELKWSKTRGSTASSAFWIAFAVGRLSGIVSLKFINISVIIVIFSSILTLGALLFLFAVMYGQNVLVWLSVVVVGYGMSVMFSIVFSWLSQNIRTLTGKIASILFVFMCIGNMAIPILVGYLMDKISQLWFIYSLLIFSVAMFTIFIFAIVLFYLLKKAQDKSNQSKVILSAPETS